VHGVAGQLCFTFTEEMAKSYKPFVEQPETKIFQAGPKRKREDNIKMGLK
jgi:hypothetical protein